MPRINYNQPILVDNQIVNIPRAESYGEDWNWFRVKSITFQWFTIPLAGLLLILVGYGIGGCNLRPTQSSSAGSTTGSETTGTVTTITSPPIIIQTPAPTVVFQPSVPAAPITNTVLAPVPPPPQPIISDRPKNIWDNPRNR